MTSSDFPRYDRNLNTGGPFGEEVTGRVAVNTVYHDRSHPSHVLLPILSPRYAREQEREETDPRPGCQVTGYARKYALKLLKQAEAITELRATRDGVGAAVLV